MPDPVPASSLSDRPSPAPGDGYKALFENMDEGFCVVEMIYDPSGHPTDYRFVEINPAFEANTGLHEALGRTIREMVPDHDAHWFEIYDRVSRTGESARFENAAVAMNRYYDVFAYRIGSEGCFRVGILFKDISGHKKAEAALLESENKFRALFKNLMEGVALHQLVRDDAGTVVDYRILDVNPAFEVQTGLKADEVRGRLGTEAYVTEKPPYFDVYQKVALGGGNHVFETYFPPLDKYFKISVISPQTDQFATLFEDITERKRADEVMEAKAQALEEAVRFNEQILKSAGDGIIVYGPDLRYQVWNAFMERFSGLPATKVLGKHPSELFPFLADSGVLETLQKILEGGPAQAYEFPFKVPSTGHVGWASDTSSPLYNAKGEIAGVMAIVRDITDNKRMFDELTDREYFFRESQYAGAIGSYRADFVKDSWQSSEVLDDIFGIDQDYVRNVQGWLALVHDDDKAMMIHHLNDEVIGKRQTFDKEYRIIRKRDGEIRWVYGRGVGAWDALGQVQSLTGTIQDITERVLAEEAKLKLLGQLQQSQKMEGLGIMAGGVAHDMNNVLGAILSLASAHLTVQAKDSSVYPALETIRDAAVRGGNMVKGLLRFARQNPAESLNLDLNALLREAANLLEHTMLNKVRMEWDLACDLRLVRGDGSALIHAFMNLCINAVDAMQDGGTLTFRTQNLGDRQVRVIVEDTGCGMTKEVLAKALDPFFTTKEVGKGTGLGLPMVYSVVKAHGGHLAIQSEPGRSTQVTMCFAAATTMDLGTEGQGKAQPGLESTARSILFVDDDDLILRSTRMMVEILGHAVTPATSGEEAIAILEAGYRPDVVVLDMNMPGYGGKGTLPRLRALCPTVPVLLATGRADQEALDLVAAYPWVTLLAKPYGIEDLQHCLHSISQTLR